MSQVEIQCRATCTYCSKQETFWAVAEQGKKNTLVVEAYSVPEGWYRGFRYMSDRRTLECEKCKEVTHY